MRVIETEIRGVFVLEPQVFIDERGFFLESYNQRIFAKLGIQYTFVQDNHSMSKAGTIRGLHYQLRSPQAKLCRVVRGAVFDVAVDVRLGSPTFGKWVSAILSEENRRQILIPPGFAHGFSVLSPFAEGGIRWDDPDLAIPWGLRDATTSRKDASHPFLRDIACDRLPTYGIGL